MINYIISVRLDSCHSAINCHLVAFHHEQYFQWDYLVGIDNWQMSCSLLTFARVFRFLVPVSMIICNDIMAYMFGFFFGRTPLIKLSPKKTWEGFIGGGISTLVFALIFAQVLINYDYFVCPLEYDDVKGALSMECVRNPVFRPVIYEMPSYLVSLALLRQLLSGHYLPVLHSTEQSHAVSVLQALYHNGDFLVGCRAVWRILCEWLQKGI